MAVPQTVRRLDVTRIEETKKQGSEEDWTGGSRRHPLSLDGPAPETDHARVKGNGSATSRPSHAESWEKAARTLARRFRSSSCFGRGGRRSGTEEVAPPPRDPESDARGNGTLKDGGR